MIWELNTIIDTQETIAGEGYSQLMSQPLQSEELIDLFHRVIQVIRAIPHLLRKICAL